MSTSLSTATDQIPGAGYDNRNPPPVSVVPLLRLENISKHFPGVIALNNINFDVKASEVHVLFGENGAGKSTLIQTIAGVHRPTTGKIFINGKEEVMSSVHHARELGVSAVFQEFSVIPSLTIEENLFLGSEMERYGILDKVKLHRQAKEILQRLGFPLNPSHSAIHLSRAELQMVEIAKAFRTKPSIMILDEPTASLTERETNQLFGLINTLKEEGIGIIYITHRMNEIKRIGDRITVLRDGNFIDTVSVDGVSEEQLISLMVGRVVDQIFPKIKNNPGEICLKVENMSLAGHLANNISINVCPGEVVGLAGLVGSGKSDIGRAVFGDSKIVSGKISFLGEAVFDSEHKLDDITPRAMLDRGLYYVPSDRHKEGLVMMSSARENTSLPSLELAKFAKRLLLRRNHEKKIVKNTLGKLDLSPFNIERDVEHFSGGNQQKILIAKALVREVKCFIFDEPTVGVDVGARILIYNLIGELCEAGAAVLLISSDLPEILHLTHRTYVIHRGHLVAELPANKTTEETVLNYFFDKEQNEH